jgi:hypothetical protein
VNFTGVTVHDAPIATGANLSELSLSAPDGTTLATPSALTAGNAFSGTSDGPAPPTAPAPLAGVSGTKGDRFRTTCCDI